MKRFVCSDESLNSYGFWVKTDGIDLSRFMKNPVMLWNHIRSGSYGNKNDVLPIGYWKDIKVENGQLTAEPVFDEKDEFAKSIKDKVEQGIIRSCSVGIRVMQTSSEPEHLKAGQTGETVVACQLLEISLCDIPSNENAVALYDENETLLTLSLAGKVVKPIITNNTNMKELNLALGLPEDAAEELAVKEIKSLRERVETLEKEKKEAEEAALNEAVTEAIRQRKTTEAKRETYLRIGRQNGIAVLKEVLAELSEPVKPSQLINAGSDTAGKEDFAALSADEKESMRKNDPERYAKLYEAHYGFKPELD